MRHTCGGAVVAGLIFMKDDLVAAWKGYSNVHR